jgi:hypothetical protein
MRAWWPLALSLADSLQHAVPALPAARKYAFFVSCDLDDLLCISIASRCVTTQSHSVINFAQSDSVDIFCESVCRGFSGRCLCWLGYHWLTSHQVAWVRVAVFYFFFIKWLCIAQV